MKYGLLEFYEDPQETSSDIYDLIIDITVANELRVSQVHMELTMHL